MKTWLKRIVSAVLAAALFFTLPVKFETPGDKAYASGWESVTPNWKYTEQDSRYYYKVNNVKWQKDENLTKKYSEMEGKAGAGGLFNKTPIRLSGSKSNESFGTPVTVSTSKYKDYAMLMQYLPFTLSVYVPSYSEIQMTYNFSVEGEKLTYNTYSNKNITDGSVNAEVFCWDDGAISSGSQLQFGRTSSLSPCNPKGARAVWTDGDSKNRINYTVTVTYENHTGSAKYISKNFAYAVSQTETVTNMNNTGSHWTEVKKATLTVKATKAEQRQYDALYQETAGGEWLGAFFGNALDKVYGGGTVKLLDNVVLEKQYGISKNITITSNNSSSPKTMTRAADKKTNFNVNSGGTLTLKDIIYDGGGKSVTADAQGLSMFRVPAGGTLNLQSGCVLRNNYKSSGSGNVAIYGTMTMENGASITGCEITGGGGAVWIAEGGTFTMNGGTISGCTASSGGAAISADGTFIMNGGTISGNTDSSANKCDVLLRADKSGNVTLKGGTISGNTNSVYNNGMTVTIAGSPAVSGKIYSANAINASGSTSKNYTVQMSAIPADKIIVKGSTDTAHWSLANEGYVLLASGGNLIAAQPVTVTYNYGGATGGNSLKTKTVYVDDTYGDLPAPTKTGYNFGGWFTASSGGTQVTSSTTVTNASAHTLYARWSVCSHTWDSGTVTKQPTCSAVGTKEFTCTKCGQTKTENVDMKPHTPVTDKAKPATCTATGLTKGSHCSVCNTVIEAQTTVPMIAHTEAIDKAVEATCTKTGKTEGRHCSVCGTVIKAQTVIPSNGHKWSDDYSHSVEQHWRMCEVCGADETKTGHVWDGGTETKPATEYDEGETLYRCTLCEQTKTEPIHKLPHTHKWSDEWSTDDNYHWYECTECGAHKQDIAHDWQHDGVLLEPNCTEGGTTKYVCSQCGEKKTENDISPNGHKYNDEWEYDENGHWHLCTACQTETADMAVHQWDNGTVGISPTCTDAGTMIYKCTVCECTKTESIPVKAEAHSWNDWMITSEPTDKATGLAERICKLNDEHIERVELPALTDEDFWEKGKFTAPKCVEDGAQVYICIYGEFAVVIPQTGHTPVTDNRVDPTCEDTGLTEGSHCETCGTTLENQEVISENGHKWNDGEIVVQPTEKSEGLKLFTCTVCGKTKTEVIPANGNISKEVQPGENVPDTKLETPLDKLIETILTSEETERVNDGINIKIVLTIEDGTNFTPAEDKEKVQTAISELLDYKLGQYLDVNLLKIIGDSQEKITKINAPIVVMFEVPQTLRGMEKYSVIRIHNGETTVLEDEDDNPDTITVKTDKFSTYALTYQDRAAGEPGGDDNSSGDDNSDSSSDTVPSGDGNSSDENTHTPNVENSVSSESDTGKPNGNPSTGVAISFVPLAAVAALITAAAKRKKK